VQALGPGATVSLSASSRAKNEVIVRGPSASPSPACGTILFAGGAALQEQLAAALGEGCRLTSAPIGPGALRLARQSAPDAILCQHSPPEVNGLRIVSIAKSDPTLFTIPVVLVLETDAPAGVEQALDLGADDVLSPGLDPAVLRARVRAAVRSRRALRQLVDKHAELTRMNGLLAASRARNRAIVESSHHGILMLLPGGAIESTNPAARRALLLPGKGEAEGPRSFLEFIAPRSRAEVGAELARAAGERRAEAAPAAAREGFGLRSDGVEFPLECRVVPIDTPEGRRLCVFLRDLTEPRRLMFELQHAQKLESVGRLAAGIAHELNTPIQYVGDNTRFLRAAFEAVSGMLVEYRRAVGSGALDPAATGALEVAAQQRDLAYFLEQVPGTIASTVQGVERVAAIVRAMKEFAHPDRTEMVATDLNRALLATLEVARNEYKYVADVHTDLGELPRVVCHAGEVNQVFLNVIVNAAHAIEDVVKGTGRRGEIRVATRRDGAEAQISVADTGAGIPEEIRGRIFDPFFTTKEVGRGTGQGLAIAHSVLKRHGGRISFQTAVGAGTTFEIRLPLAPPGR